MGRTLISRRKRLSALLTAAVIVATTLAMGLQQTAGAVTATWTTSAQFDQGTYQGPREPVTNSLWAQPQRPFP